MSIRKTTRDIVGGSVLLGAGGIALETMGKGEIVAPTIGRGASMMGAVIPAAYGMEVLKMLKPKKRRY